MVTQAQNHCSITESTIIMQRYCTLSCNTKKSVMIQMTSGRETGWETVLLYYQDLLVNTGKCKVVCVGVCVGGGGGR